MSLQNAVETPEGEFINEPITATVKFPQEKQYNGRTFYTALLEDGQFKANVSCNADLFSANNNKRTTFSVEGKGKGFSIKRKGDFSGKAQLGFGDNVSASPAGAATPGQQAATSHSQQTQAFQTPPPKPPQRQGVEGVTVGMAINKAVDIYCRYGRELTGTHSWDNGKYVKEIASDLIRIAHDLQAGNLSIPPNDLPPDEQGDEDVPY
jgi:hypothetical protein